MKALRDIASTPPEPGAPRAAWVAWLAARADAGDPAAVVDLLLGAITCDTDIPEATATRLRAALLRYEAAEADTLDEALGLRWAKPSRRAKRWTLIWTAVVHARHVWNVRRLVDSELSRIRRGERRAFLRRMELRGPTAEELMAQAARERTAATLGMTAAQVADFYADGLDTAGVRGMADVFALVAPLVGRSPGTVKSVFYRAERYIAAATSRRD